MALSSMRDAVVGAIDDVYNVYDTHLAAPLKLFTMTLQRGHFQAAQDMIPDIEGQVSLFFGAIEDLKAKAEKQYASQKPVAPAPQAVGPEAPAVPPGGGAG